MIFVDTGVWYAAHVSEDPDHGPARELLRAGRGRLLTTDYVIDELATLLTIRGHRGIAVTLCSELWKGTICRLTWTTPTDAAEAWDVFVRFEDKLWSFTDCVSYAVMKRFGIDEAYSLDEHFEQFGFVVVKP
jgi:uncharacterized protein